jgi:hypothetical protein
MIPSLGTGYGAVRAHNTSAGVHRLSWVMRNGPVPDKLHVLHHCDVMLCCNPKHLFLGTPQDNSRDMMRKHRHAPPEVMARGSDTGAAKLSESDVREILRRVAAGEAQAEIARDLGIVRTTVCHIVHGRSWRHVSRPKKALVTAASLHAIRSRGMKAAHKNMSRKTKIRRNRKISQPRA